MSVSLTTATEFDLISKSKATSKSGSPVKVMHIIVRQVVEDPVKVNLIVRDF